MSSGGSRVATSDGSQGARLGDLGSSRRTLADDPVPAVRLEAGDRTDGDPRGVVVDRAHLSREPMDEHQSRSALRRVDRKRAAPIPESRDPRRQVVDIVRELDQGGADRGQVGRRGRSRAGDPLEQRSDRGVDPSENIRHVRIIRAHDAGWVS